MDKDHQDPASSICSLGSRTQYTAAEAELGDNDGSQAGLDDMRLAASVYNPTARNVL